MARPTGESKDRVLRLYFDRRLKLEFHGSKVTSDAGLLPYRELDDAVGLTEIAGDVLTDTRRGKNGREPLWVSRRLFGLSRDSSRDVKPQNRPKFIRAFRQWPRLSCDNV